MLKMDALSPRMHLMGGVERGNQLRRSSMPPPAPPAAAAAAAASSACVHGRVPFLLPRPPVRTSSGGSNRASPPQGQRPHRGQRSGGRPLEHIAWAALEEVGMEFLAVLVPAVGGKERGGRWDGAAPAADARNPHNGSLAGRRIHEQPPVAECSMAARRGRARAGWSADKSANSGDQDWIDRWRPPREERGIERGFVCLASVGDGVFCHADAGTVRKANSLMPFLFCLLLLDLALKGRATLPLSD
jgi:hypothetical protein